MNSTTTLNKRHLSFNTRSLLLMATFTLGAAGALQAQAQTPTAATSKATSPFSVGPSSGPSAGPAAVQASSDSVAFDRADTDKNGVLSEQESVRLPAIHKRFKALDTDSNGSLSRAEFDKGAQP